MENSNETKAFIYNNMIKEILDIISQDCRKEVEKIIDERLEHLKTIAMSNAMDIEEIRAKYVIYNDLKNLL
jgi:ATP-dependent Zn protease